MSDVIYISEKKRKLTGIALIIAKAILDRSPATQNFPEVCMWFSLQELNPHNEKNYDDDDQRLPVVGKSPVINVSVE